MRGFLRMIRGVAVRERITCAVRQPKSALAPLVPRRDEGGPMTASLFYRLPLRQALFIGKVVSRWATLLKNFR